MAETLTARSALPERLSAWLDGAIGAWVGAWVDRLAREVRAFAAIPLDVLDAQVNRHAASLVRLLSEGDSQPLLAFYSELVRDGRKRGLGLPDMVAALVLGRGLLRRLARESSGELRAAWDEAIAESLTSP